MPVRFFIDNNLSRQLSEGMKGFGEPVMHLKEKFEGDVADPVWLEFLGRTGRTLITRDERIRWRPAEKQALWNHKVGAFFLGGKNLTRCQLIQQLVRNWPQLKEIAQKTSPPFAFRVPPRGRKITRLSLR